jgi:hypothetical protein
MLPHVDVGREGACWLGPGKNGVAHDISPYISNAGSPHPLRRIDRHVRLLPPTPAGPAHRPSSSASLPPHCDTPLHPEIARHVLAATRLRRAIGMGAALRQAAQVLAPLGSWQARQCPVRRAKAARNAHRTGPDRSPRS